MGFFTFCERNLIHLSKASSKAGDQGATYVKSGRKLPEVEGEPFRTRALGSRVTLLSCFLSWLHPYMRVVTIWSLCICFYGRGLGQSFLAGPFGQAIMSVLLNQCHEVELGSGGNAGGAGYQKNMFFKEWCCVLPLHVALALLLCLVAPWRCWDRAFLCGERTRCWSRLNKLKQLSLWASFSSCVSFQFLILHQFCLRPGSEQSSCFHWLLCLYQVLVVSKQ